MIINNNYNDEDVVIFIEKKHNNNDDEDDVIFIEKIYNNSNVPYLDDFNEYYPIDKISHAITYGGEVHYLVNFVNMPHLNRYVNVINIKADQLIDDNISILAAIMSERKR
jgi:hypothetical protein